VKVIEIPGASAWCDGGNTIAGLLKGLGQLVVCTNVSMTGYTHTMVSHYVMLP